MTETDKYPRCGECGGDVELVAKPGRTRRMEPGVEEPIPENFEIPTCVKCGNEYMDLATSERLDLTLEIQMTFKLLEEELFPPAAKTILGHVFIKAIGDPNTLELMKDHGLVEHLVDLWQVLDGIANCVGLPQFEEVPESITDALSDEPADLQLLSRLIEIALQDLKFLEHILSGGEPDPHPFG